MHTDDTHTPEPDRPGPSTERAVGVDGLDVEQRAALYRRYHEVLDAVIMLDGDGSAAAAIARPLLTQDTRVHFALARALAEHDARAQPSPSM